jgi:hypothetical protein
MAAPYQFNWRVAVTANADRQKHPEHRDRRGDLSDLHRIERATPFRNPNVSDGNFRDVPRHRQSTSPLLIAVFVVVLPLPMGKCAAVSSARPEATGYRA